MYVIIEFILEGTIEMVPRDWLRKDDKICLWPPAKNAINYIKRMKNPEEDWKGFAVNILDEAATYDEARKKLRKVTLASNSGGMSATNRKRRGQRMHPELAKNISDSQSESEEEYTNKKTCSILNDLPEVQKFLLEMQTQGASFSDFFDNTVSKDYPVLMAKSDDTELRHQENVAKVSVATQTEDVSLKSDILKKILRGICIIKAKLDEHTNILDTLRERPALQEDNMSSLPAKNFANLPLKTIDDVMRHEEHLNSPENELSLFTKLKTFGGSLYADHTRRILRYIFTDKCAELYSWLGNKEKNRFSSLKVCKIIVDAVQSENEQVTRSQIEDVVKNWIRHAKERRVYAEKFLHKR